jgi:hypothetical protein
MKPPPVHSQHIVYADLSARSESTPHGDVKADRGARRGFLRIFSELMQDLRFLAEVGADSRHHNFLERDTK